MRNLKTLLFAFLLLAMAACSGNEAALTTLQEEMEETATDVAAAIAAAQEDIADIGQRIQESEASDDLQAAWEDLQADLTALFTSLQSEGTVDTTQVEQFMDDFEGQLDAAGDQITPELRDAWDTLRATIESLIEQAG
jgi:chromosome segregation ATPase